MFPFDYIPETIDPVLRKIIVILISVQVVAFFLYIVMIISDHKKAKQSAENKEESNELKDDSNNLSNTEYSKDSNKIKDD